MSENLTAIREMSGSCEENLSGENFTVSFTFRATPVFSSSVLVVELSN